MRRAWVGLLLAGCVFAGAAEEKVGTLDLGVIFSRYKKVKSLETDLSEKFGERQKQLELAYKAIPADNPSKKEIKQKQTLDSMAEKLDKEIATARAVGLRDILNAVTAATEKVAKKQKVAFVIRADEAGDVSKPADYKRPAPMNLDTNDAEKLVAEFRKDIVMYRKDDGVDFPEDLSKQVDLTKGVLEALKGE